MNGASRRWNGVVTMVKPIEQRLTALEVEAARKGAATGRLTLLSVRGELTPEQRDQAAAARATRRELFVVDIREGLHPGARAD